MSNQVIVVGGGLSGLSAAHTILEHGLNVLVIDKNAFFGGNSTKATSGINGALTKTQIRKCYTLASPRLPSFFKQFPGHAARKQVCSGDDKRQQSL